MWGETVLESGIGDLISSHQTNEEHMAVNYPGFFADESNQLEPADLKQLKRRCAQEARSFWYEWRTTVEQDIHKKVGHHIAHLQAELERVATMRAAAEQVARQLVAAQPPPTVAADAADAAGRARESANAVALRQTEVARAESAQHSLQQQLLAAEKEQLRAKEHSRAQQTRLAELTAAVAAAAAAASPEVAEGGAAIEGDALLDALQVMATDGH